MYHRVVTEPRLAEAWAWSLAHSWHIAAGAALACIVLALAQWIAHRRTPAPDPLSLLGSVLPDTQPATVEQIGEGIYRLPGGDYVFAPSAIIATAARGELVSDRAARSLMRVCVARALDADGVPQIPGRVVELAEAA